MHVALWEGDFDSVFVKPVPNAQENLTFYVGNSVRRITDPKAKFQVYRTIAKTFEQACRLRVFDDPRDSMCGVYAERDRFSHIRFI